MDMYKPKARRLYSALMKEDKIEREIKAVALIAVITEAYGMGDALAGLVMRGIPKSSQFEEIKDNVEFTGRVVAISPYPGLANMMDHVANKYDSEVLRKYMKSGRIEE